MTILEFSWTLVYPSVCMKLFDHFVILSYFPS